MLKLARTSDIVPFQYLPDTLQLSLYSVVGNQEKGYFLFRAYRDCRQELQVVPHRGLRTGEIVRFSRYSDADRLCDTLNAQLERCA